MSDTRRGWKVQVNDCEWVIVQAADAASAEQIGWEEFARFSGFTRESARDEFGDEETIVTPIPELDGGELTMRRLVDLGLCVPESVEDYSGMDTPETAIHLSTEW